LRLVGGERTDVEPNSPDRYHIDACLEAILALDAPRLHACLDRAFLSMGRLAVLERVLLPLMRDVGERWRNGSMRVMHEHFASSVVRTLMEGFSIGSRPEAGAPLLLATTPAGQIHEMGALFTVASAAADGWRTLYLGPGLAAEEIAAAARQRAARVVALSLIYPLDDARIGRELIRLRSMLPAEVAIVVGGAAAPAYRETLEAIGALCPSSLAEFRRILAQLRSVPG
jgi:methylmalonyl-CoA mutase cobalamin-binding subunit